MLTAKLFPLGKKCALRDCPPGLFEFKGTIGFKNEYGYDSRPDQRGHNVYCAGTGEYFWGGADTPEALLRLVVQPLAIDI